MNQAIEPGACMALSNVGSYELDSLERYFLYYWMWANLNCEFPSLSFKEISAYVITSICWYQWIEIPIYWTLNIVPFKSYVVALLFSVTSHSLRVIQRWFHVQDWYQVTSDIMYKMVMWLGEMVKAYFIT